MPLPFLPLPTLASPRQSYTQQMAGSSWMLITTPQPSIRKNTVHKASWGDPFARGHS